ncbi:MAG: ATP-binding protein [Rhodocyclaceae bacterium]|nr:ATP-binding protein [Rhodocyclaceae bacterium]
MPMIFPPSPALPAGHLPRLVNLRWLEVASQFLVLGIARLGLGMDLPVAAMAGVTLSLAGANALTWLRLRSHWPVTDTELFSQLCADVLALATLLYLSGGSANPFVSLLLLPLTIAATTLAPRLAWAMAALTVATYTLLLFHSLPLPEPSIQLPLVQRLVVGDALPPDACHVEPPAGSHGGHNSPSTAGTSGNATGFALHVLGMWFNFLVSGLVVAFFLTRMAATLRDRERELAAAREKALRHEQILALGTLAAGAAHQLGTPLSTLAVVLREMELEHGADDPRLAEDLALARQQVGRCKGILSDILADAGHHRSEGGEAVDVESFLRSMVEDWRLLRPGVKLRLDMDGPRPAPSLMTDRTLGHALLNLLDNAADASPELEVELRVRWQAASCVLEILDRGAGFTSTPQPGRPFLSTKADKGGLGIGLFLSNATLERFGGKVELFNREGGGACTRVTLPLRISET